MVALQGKLGKQKATTPANAPSPFFAIPVGGGQGATPPSATSGSLGAPPQATPRGSGTNSTPASTGTLTPTGPPTNVGGSKTPGTPPSTGGSPPPSLVGSPPTTPATTTPTTPTNGKKAGPLADYSSSTGKLGLRRKQDALKCICSYVSHFVLFCSNLMLCCHLVTCHTITRKSIKGPPASVCWHSSFAAYMKGVSHLSCLQTMGQLGPSRTAKFMGARQTSSAQATMKFQPAAMAVTATHLLMAAG